MASFGRYTPRNGIVIASKNEIFIVDKVNKCHVRIWEPTTVRQEVRIEGYHGFSTLQEVELTFLADRLIVPEQFEAHTIRYLPPKKEQHEQARFRNRLRLESSYSD